MFIFCKKNATFTENPPPHRVPRRTRRAAARTETEGGEESLRGESTMTGPGRDARMMEDLSGKLEL